MPEEEITQDHLDELSKAKTVGEICATRAGRAALKHGPFADHLRNIADHLGDTHPPELQKTEAPK